MHARAVRCSGRTKSFFRGQGTEAFSHLLLLPTAHFSNRPPAPYTSKYSTNHPQPPSNRHVQVPQEAIPRDVADKVANEMIQEFRGLLAKGAPRGGARGGSFPRPVFTRVQLWGAALPLNTPGVPCILDPDSRVSHGGVGASQGSPTRGRARASSRG